MEQGGGERAKRKRIEWNMLVLVVDVGGCRIFAQFIVRNLKKNTQK